MRPRPSHILRALLGVFLALVVTLSYPLHLATERSDPPSDKCDICWLLVNPAEANEPPAAGPRTVPVEQTLPEAYCSVVLSFEPHPAAAPRAPPCA